MHVVQSRFKGRDVQFFIDQDGQAWWPAKGPCEVLEYDLGHISDVLSRFVDDEDKRLFNLPDSRGGWRETLAIDTFNIFHDA